MSPRPPPKISLRHDHDWTRGKVPLGSTVEQQPVGKVVRQSRGEVQHATFSQPTQPIPKPICDRSGQPDNTQDVFLFKVKRPVPMRSMKKVFTENSVLQIDQGEQHAPEVHREVALLNTDNEFNREINEEDIDFNIPGLPLSTVKQLHSASVRELIQKIENHSHRHALQRDLQQRQQFNPFSKESKETLQRDLQQRQKFNPFSQESKDMIREVGNIELCELLDVEPKAQCRVCLSYWDVGIVYCTCGHFLRNGTEENKKYVQYTMDLLSIPN